MGGSQWLCGTTPEGQVMTEIGEETSLNEADVSLRKKGEPLTVEDEQVGIR